MEDFEKIFIVKNEVEASFWEMVLQEREIPHVLRSYHDSAYDGLFQMQKGWGVLYAPEKYRTVIEAIRSEVDSENPDHEAEEA